MSFLFPAMLAGLASLALPVVLHLIARQKFPVLHFPTIRLLEGERRANTLAPRLVDVWQLILRLLVLLLIVLAMSRFFAPWLSNQPATHNRVIVIDASAGMMQLVEAPGGKGKITVFDLAKKRAQDLMEEVSAPSRTSLVIAGETSRIASPLEPGHDHALESLAQAKPFDASGSGLVEAVAVACDMLRGRREISSEVIVLTNLHKSGFEVRGQRDQERILEAQSELGDSLHLLFVDLSPKATENLAITSGYVRGREVMVGADAHVISTIVNTGQQEQTTKVTLAIGDRKEPFTRQVKIAPGSTAVVDMTARVNRAMRTVGQVAIDEDSYAADDHFDVPVPVVDTRRVLIVNGQPKPDAGAAGVGGGNALSGESAAPAPANAANHDSDIDGATILRFVLNPGRELGGSSNSGIDPVMVTPEAVAVQPLSKYEIVILYDVSSLPDQVMRDLATFVGEGKSLLIVCSAKTSAANFNRSLATSAADRPALAPAELGNDIESETPLEPLLKDMSHPLLSAFSDPRKGDLSILRFQKIRSIQRMPDDTGVVLASTAGQPLIIERALGRGRVVMLTFGFELDRGNIARTRVFPPLMWRTIDYLTGALRTLPPDQLVARTPGVLDVSEANFALTSDLELAPGGASQAGPTTAPSKAGEVAATQPQAEAIHLTASPDRTVLLSGLAPGRYLLQKARVPGEGNQIVTYARTVTVQNDPRQSDMTREPAEDLKHLFGERVLTITGELPTDLVPRGAEFWKILVIALILGYAVEAIVGFIVGARREKERAPGMVNEGVTP